MKGAPRGPLSIVLDAHELRVGASLPAAGETATWATNLTSWNAAREDWPDLDAAMRDLLGDGGRGRHVAVALHWPLATTRLVRMPRLRAADRRMVLTRDASRYFAVPEAPHVADGVVLGRGGGQDRVLIAASDARLVRAIHRAIEGAGGVVDTIVPAAAAMITGLRGAQGRVLVRDGEAYLGLELSRGDLTSFRRFTNAAAAHEWASAMESRERGLQDAVAADREVRSLDPAIWASRVAGPELVSPEASVARQRARARLVRGLVTGGLGAAAVGLICSGWGLSRELRAVERERARVHEAVASALDARTATQGAESRLAVLRALEQGRPRWVSRIADVGEQLPADAHLTGLRGSVDSLIVEGVAPQADPVFSSLRGLPGVVIVRADAPVQQEPGVGGASPMERFAISVRFGPDDGPGPRVGGGR